MLGRNLNEELDALFERRNQAYLLIKRLDTAIASLQAIAKETDLFSSEFRDTLGIADDQAPGESEKPDPSGDAKDGTAKERVIRFFLARNNRPACNADITKAVGTSRGAVAVVLYEKKNPRFEMVDVPGDFRKHWQLKPEALAAERAKESAKN